MTTPPRSLANVFVTMPAEEKARLAAFARRVGRPVSWVVRDAVKCYADALEADPVALARIAAPPMDFSDPVPVVPMGAPRKDNPRRARKPKA